MADRIAKTRKGVTALRAEARLGRDPKMVASCTRFLRKLRAIEKRLAAMRASEVDAAERAR